MLEYLIISSFLNGLLSIALLVLIVPSKVTQVKNVKWSFIYFVLSAILWSISYGFWLLSHDESSIYLWIKLLTIGSCLLPAFYYRFVADFIGMDSLRRLISIIFFSIAFCFSILTIFFPSLIINGLYLTSFKTPWPVAGALYLYLVLYFLIATFFSTFLLITELKKATGKRSLQIKYLLCGIGFGFLGGMTNFPLWFGLPIYPYGNILTPLYAVLTFLAITRHSLMDIKVVLRKYSVYLLSLFSVILFAGLLQYGYQKILHISNFYIDIIITGLAVSIFPILRSYYYRFANTYLFTSLYDTKQVISTLSEKLRSTLATGEIYRTLSQTIQNALHVRSIVLLTFNRDKEQYSLAYGEQAEMFNPVVQKLNQKFVDYLLSNDRPLLTGEIDATFGTLKRLLAGSTEVVVPLNLKGKHIGLILIGPKEASDAFNDEDISLLKIVGSQTAIALENALLYGEAQHFNDVLKQRINRATKQLRTQNDKLKELDEMKTEFISIASHQLRTPLTATKWALDFLLKGKDGRVSPKQRESLAELSIMNVRLITLVNELLNISRIDDGRLKIDPKPTDIVKAIKEIVAEYMPIIRKKELVLQEHYDTIPLIKLDPNVIGKAFSNIFSNAIKYNRDGKALWIEARRHKDTVSVTVKDEGIGIPAKDQGQLFQRFFRASNAAASSTEGTGFGLYIAKSALEMSGGSISFESKEGVGTTFVITLPLKGSKARKGEKSLA